MATGVAEEDFGGGGGGRRRWWSKVVGVPEAEERHEDRRCE